MRPYSAFSLCIQLLLLAMLSYCKGQEKPSRTEEFEEIGDLFTLPFARDADGQGDTRIGQYVVEIFEDSKHNLWLGTMANGAARYDGHNLVYFSTKDGLGSNTIACIREDREGNLWFATHSGLSRYDGRTFTNFTVKDGLCHNRVSDLLFDSKGRLWVGTWGGVCRYESGTFVAFSLPRPNIELPAYLATMNWVTAIIEDRQANIWFARSGYGVCRYDGNSFAQFSKAEGLASNCVQAMLEDRHGNLWFASRVAEKDHPEVGKRTGDGGLSMYDGRDFIRFPEIDGLSKNDIYELYEDDAGNIWTGANGFGVYRYGAEGFDLYQEIDRPDLAEGFGLQSILKDSRGDMWFGFSGGLFRLEGRSFVHVSRNGPWNF